MSHDGYYDLHEFYARSSLDIKEAQLECSSPEIQSNLAQAVAAERARASVDGHIGLRREQPQIVHEILDFRLSRTDNSQPAPSIQQKQPG